MASYNTYDMFNANGLEDGGQTTVNTNKGVADILSHMSEVPPMFKVLQSFVTSTSIGHSHAHFTHGGGCFEYLLGDPNYIGENMFIMRRLGNVEKPSKIDDRALMAYNKMHVGYRVRVERVISGLKCKL